MKIYEVDFEPLYPVGNCLIIAANNEEEANRIALKTCWTHIFTIKEVDISKPKVIMYLDGNY